MRGTTINATVKRVVDGDTLWIEEFDKSIRILSLDTEESHPGAKPVTPWGKEATRFATELLPVGSKVTLEFQGDDPEDEVFGRYVDNYGRGLAWVHLEDGRDFQEVMIQKGYSPYFTKYGYAEWPALHQAYVEAERAAQAENIGVWNQLEVNGSEVRNYAVLSCWWELRASLVESYRQTKQAQPGKAIYNTRKDYLELRTLAADTPQVTIFTELRSLRRTGGIHGLVSIGSHEQPFSLFIPKMDDPQPEKVVSLLKQRYLPEGDEHPRRGYAYVTGRLELYRDNPQLVVDKAEQISDTS